MTHDPANGNPSSQDRPGVLARIRQYWVEGVIAATVVGTGVTVWFAVADKWNADRANALAASAGGVLTLVGVLYALREAAAARAEARAEGLAAEKRAAAEAREIEIQRRITLEITHRQRAMDRCAEIINLISRCTIYASSLLRDAAFDIENASARATASLDLSLRWRGDRAEIGAAYLPLATSRFAYVLAELLPELDARFQDELVDVLRDGTQDDVVDATDVLANDRFNEKFEELRMAALKDFTLDMSLIRETVDAEFAVVATPTPADD